MKKIYEMPLTLVAEVELPVLMAGSPGTPDVKINPDDDVDAGEIESRRRRTVWDDEEDEEL